MSDFTPAHRGGAGAPMVLLHGFVDTWRTWELVLAVLERRYDVLAPTLGGHAGGPQIEGEANEEALLDAIERAMDEAGFVDAHVVGNSLGGFLALKLAARGRAKSVVAFAPAGGWASEDGAFATTLVPHFTTMREQLAVAVPHAEALLSTPQGRRMATQFTTTNYEHIPIALLAHQMRGVVACESAPELLAYARREGWTLDAERIVCPVRIVWGTEDRLLPWPSAAARFREEWLPNADWVQLDGIGHCPQLDVPREAAQLILGFATP
jgi:pimeloyl-ACP methyl ester carboxylesterase